MENFWETLERTKRICCSRWVKSRKVLLVSEFTVEDFRSIEDAEVPQEADCTKPETDT